MKDQLKKSVAQFSFRWKKSSILLLQLSYVYAVQSQVTHHVKKHLRNITWLRKRGLSSRDGDLQRITGFHDFLLFTWPEKVGHQNSGYFMDC